MLIQKGSCAISFKAAIAACGRRKRRENGTKITCFSPWSIISCWFDSEKSKGGKNVDGLQSHDDNTDTKSVIGCLHQKSSSSDQEVLDEPWKDASFSLGVGFAIIHLMATTKIELDRMVDLRKQIEALLETFKRELQNRCKDTNDDISCSLTSKVQETPNYTTEHVSLEENSESDIDTNSYKNSNCKTKKKGKGVEMDQLEAELEAELEHLQLQLDNEVVLDYSNLKCSEIVVQDTALEPEESKDTRFDEVLEQPEIGNMEYYLGVSPRVLQSRLYELQEVRQQEKIKELELALEYALEKLDENQRELSWWKDTAKVVYQRIPIRCRSVR